MFDLPRREATYVFGRIRHFRDSAWSSLNKFVECSLSRGLQLTMPLAFDPLWQGTCMTTTSFQRTQSVFQNFLPNGIKLILEAGSS